MNDDFSRQKLRLLWRTYAATQPTAQRAWGMAAALKRYYDALRIRRRTGPGGAGNDGPIAPIAPVAGTARTRRID